MTVIVLPVIGKNWLRRQFIFGQTTIFFELVIDRVFFYKMNKIIFNISFYSGRTGVSSDSFQFKTFALEHPLLPSPQVPN